MTQPPVHPQVPNSQAPQFQQPQYWQPVDSGRTNRLNVLGIVALSLLVIEGVLQPVLTYAFILGGNGAGAANTSTIISIMFIFFTLVATGLALGGVLQRSAPRLRWTAIGALVAGSLSLLGSLAFMIAGAIYNALS